MQLAMLLIYLQAIDGGETTLAIGRRLVTQLAFILVYLAPSIVAQRYQHPKQPVILMLNVALGWTIVGWVFALIWALKARPQE
jgi:Superinfection immunity protein